MKTKCAKCGTEIDPLEVFPRGLCLKCHARIEDKKPLPSAQEFAKQWKRTINKIK